MSAYSDLINVLKNNIDDKIVHHPDPVNTSRVVFEERTNPSVTKLKKITITGFSEVLAINQDKITPYKPNILKNTQGINKTCDGIVLSIIDGQPCVLVFDMKSSLSNMEEHKLKMKCARNFLSYLDCVLKEFLQKSLKDWEVYYCVFYIADPKRTTEIQQPVSHDPNSPVYHCVEDGEILSIRKILGKPLIQHL